MLVALLAVVIAGAGILYLHFFSASPTQHCRVVLHWGEAARGDARLYHPMALAWHDSLLYVAEPEQGAVKRFRDDGSYLSTWRGFERPVAVAASDSAVYVTDFLTDQVVKLNLQGTVIGRWGRHGAGPAEFDAPGGIGVDRSGHVYVADLYNHRVQKFTGDGRFILQWGGRGRRGGQLYFPTGVAVSPQGEVVVADGYNHRVQRFTSGGRYLGKWGGIEYGLGGGWPGWFRLAKDVTVDPAGQVYVADAFNGRVQKFTAAGSLLAIWGDVRQGPDTLRYASGVAAAADGSVYVSDFFNNDIWKLACTGP